MNRCLQFILLLLAAPAFGYAPQPRCIFNAVQNVSWSAQEPDGTRTGALTLSGATPVPATSVTVNGLAAQTYSDLTFARTNLSLANGPNTFSNVAQNIYGVKATNILTLTLSNTVVLLYDSNGNLTNDGTRVFIYDAENRLVTNFVATAWKSEFVYDGLGRRRIERDYGWQGGAWSKTNEIHYVYDGWLAIQERDANNNVLVSYTRGLDLSATLQGAGGIGGLLARTDGNGSIFYHADGAGNVTALMDGYQNIAARYLYGPFGRLTGKWGALADVNEMQFSSMPVHRQSGIVGFWGRGYDPSLQRWTTRDPIGEAGGINLYGFVGNNPVSYVDPLGLSWYKDLFNFVGDQELALADAVKQFFLGPPGGVQLKDPDIARAGSGLIQGLKDENGNDVTKETLAGIGLTPLLAVLGGPEREAASILGNAGKLNKLRKCPKPINLPKWKKIGVDMEHILSGHTAGGIRAIQSGGKDIFPEWMTPSQIEDAIREAYRYGQKVASQGDRVLVSGPFGQGTIQMWVNTATRTIESAWPK